jgi:phospholipid transport system substrate-binding protein|tara:strand:- start:398 stop:997 length:600 start_codon:yes stop_codon:yes gene_type:complete
MTKIRFHIYILLLYCSFNLTVLASSFTEEENFVTSFADSAISILSNDSLSDDERTSSFTELVMSSIDLNLISKFVLSKTWKNASDDQKEAYLFAFKDYFISSYANKLDQYTGEKVDVIGSQEAGKYVIVESNIIREGTDTLKINLKWRLLNKDNQIKIIDLNIEGISLVIAQREEFQSFLANNDYDLDKLIEKIVSVSD